jgi:hypothetical protein
LRILTSLLYVRSIVLDIDQREGFFGFQNARLLLQLTRRRKTANASSAGTAGVWWCSVALEIATP